jgi:hypothetical protein
MKIGSSPGWRRSAAQGERPLIKTNVRFILGTVGKAGASRCQNSRANKKRSEENDVYKDAVLTTAGFVLKAPEIRADEKAGEVWIEILSQVGRDAKK